MKSSVKVLLLSFLFILISCKEEIELTEFQKQSIDYFQEIALNAEYNDDPNAVIKWRENVNVYLMERDSFPIQKEYILNAIDKLNPLLSDGTVINFTNDLASSNLKIYITTRNEMELLYPEMMMGVEEDIIGLAYIFWKADHHIFKGDIFIEKNELLETQESTILEELTQSLGLLNDSEWNTSSIFYQYQYEFEPERLTIEFNELDEEIIRLLYHPHLKPGFNLKKSEKVIRKIYKKKNKALL